MRISDWSSDVCSSDLHRQYRAHRRRGEPDEREDRAIFGHPRTSERDLRQWPHILCRREAEILAVPMILPPRWGKDTTAVPLNRHPGESRERVRSLCRESVSQSVAISVVVGPLHKNTTENKQII